MTNFLCLATADGLVLCEREGAEWRERGRGLKGQHVTSVSAHGGAILAGTKSGLFRSTDGGQTWREASAGPSIRHVRWLAQNDGAPAAALAGTEPAGLFVSRDGGETWRACPEVEALRKQHGWWLPYSPEGGCVRGFAFHGGRGYAAVEVGGVLRSDDGGESWGLAAGSEGDPSFDGPRESFVHPDVHSIAVHPSSPDRVFAPTGGGFYVSRDGGAAWDRRYECYCRAVWLDPADPDHLLLGPADDVDRNGRIEETRDGGRTWTAASAGSKIPWRRHMVERFAPAGDELLAVLSNGELLAAPLAALRRAQGTLEWRRILRDVADVNCAVMA